MTSTEKQFSSLFCKLCVNKACLLHGWCEHVCESVQKWAKMCKICVETSFPVAKIRIVGRHLHRSADPTGLQQKMTVILFTTMWQSSFPSEMKFLSCLLQYCSWSNWCEKVDGTFYETRINKMWVTLNWNYENLTHLLLVSVKGMLEEVLYFYIADNVLFCDDTQSFTHMQRFTLSGINPNYQTMPHPRRPHQCCCTEAL